MQTYVVSKPHLTRRRQTIARDGAEYAEVVFEGFCGTRARAVTEEKSWAFSRRGLITPHVTIRSLDDPTATRLAPIGVAGRCAVMIKGEEFKWVCTRALHGEFEWTGPHGETAIRSGLRGRFFHRERFFEVTSRTLAPSDADLLVCLATYLLVLLSNDAAAITAAVTASSVSF